MDRLQRLLGLAALRLKQLGGYIVLPIMCTIIAFDVMLRYVFNAPLNWGFEAASMLLLVVFLCGLVESFRRGAHVHMDLIHRVLPTPVRRAVGIVYALLGCFVFALLIRKAAVDIPFVYSLPRVTEKLHLPYWAFYTAIVVICSLVIAYLAMCAIEILLGRRTDIGEADESAEEHN